MILNPSKHETCPYIEFQSGTIEPDLVFKVNLIETTPFQPTVLIEADNLADLKSYSLKNFNFRGQQEDQLPSTSFLETDGLVSKEDDPLYGVLSLLGDQFSPQDQKSVSFMTQFMQEPTAVIEGESIAPSQPNRLSPLPPVNPNLTTPPQQESSSQQQPTPTKAHIPPPKSKNYKQSTKNITKNMGKLLFRFIWKSKHLLRRQMNIPSEIWEEFVSLIRQWKKENNITRQFLLSKWHAEGPHARLFRMVSKHFYRKRGFSAIFESKIEWKQMYVEKMRRFEEATSNPHGLDSLN